MPGFNKFKGAFNAPAPEESKADVYISDKGYDAHSASGHDGQLDLTQNSISEKGEPRRLLKKNLKGRHLACIALGGGIGTGLFIGSGRTLSTGGPGSVIIDYTLMGVMILTVLFALGELASLYPVPGPFSAYAARFLDPAWGFAIGWNYIMQWLATFPLEFVAGTIVIGFWNTPEVVPRGAIIAIFWVFIVIVNFFGARGYAEVEFGATMLKMLTLIGFIICAAVIDCGGSPSGTYLGAHTWYNPGAFNNNFKGFCSVLITASFAFAGTEIVGLAAAESSNPRKQLPRACKFVVYRVVVFYALVLFMITLVVPSDSPGLHGETSYDPNTSPFVLAIRMGGIKVLPSIVNAVIFLSAVSVANSSVFASTRQLHALAEQGFAPKFFGYIDRQGRPLIANIFCLLFGLLGFLIYSASEAEVFDWLLGISGLSVLFTWGSVCAAHIRFRAAWKRQGHALNEIPWVSPLGTIGSWIGLSFNILVVIAQFYLSAFPIDEGTMTGHDRAYQFFLGMISLPIMLVSFILYKVIMRTKWIPIDDIDLVTGRRAGISPEVLEQELAEKRAAPLWKKVLDVLF